jgi:hypothetical protein|nr:MAG TPA: hypothetical protein [Caudoviricetes sp.]
MELTPQQERILRNAINNHNRRITRRSDKAKWQKKLITAESIKEDLDKGEKFENFNDAIDYINYKTKTVGIKEGNRYLATFADPNSDLGYYITGEFDVPPSNSKGFSDWLEKEFDKAKDNAKLNDNEKQREDDIAALEERKNEILSHLKGGFK